MRTIGSVVGVHLPDILILATLYILTGSYLLCSNLYVIPNASSITGRTFGL